MTARVACIMGTYGRHELAREALACFLQQTAIEAATLLIYNQHPVPLAFDHPRVTVVNETPPHRGLRHIRKTMIDMIDPAVEFIHWWDDDDLYLPWHLDDCLEHIGAAAAWRPTRSWFSRRNSIFSLERNRFEGSWMIRADALRAAPMDAYPDYTDHPAIMQLLDASLDRTTDLGDFASYIYRWELGTEHVSTYGEGPSEKQAADIALLRARSTDAPLDGTLQVPDMWPRWQQFLDGIAGQVAPENLDALRARLNRANGTDRLGSG